MRDGIEFHNGKTLGADDVIYSLQRMIDPKLGLFGGAALSSVDPKRIKKLDKRTVRLTLKRKDVTILDALGAVRRGHRPGRLQPERDRQGEPERRYRPVQAAELHARPAERPCPQPELLAHGQPYFDQVVIIDFPDDTARVNALLGGQIDADRRASRPRRSR